MAIYTGFNGPLPGWFRGMSVSAPRAMLRVYVFDHLDLRSNGLVFLDNDLHFLDSHLRICALDRN
jgi:hypothetical protein